MNTNRASVNHEKIIYPELSYRIIGLTFKVFNELGYGYQEKYYQRALAKELEASELKFIQEEKVPLVYRGESIGRYFLDFVIEEKIALEIKVGKQFHARDINQLMGYLRAKRVRLGILVLFSPEGIRYRRLIL